MYLADPSSPIVVAKKAKKSKTSYKSCSLADDFAAFNDCFKDDQVTIDELVVSDEVEDYHSKDCMQDNIEKWLLSKGITIDSQDHNKVKYFANKQIKIQKRIDLFSSSSNNALPNNDYSYNHLVEDKRSRLRQRLNLNLELNNEYVFSILLRESNQQKPHSSTNYKNDDKSYICGLSSINLSQS